MYSPSLTKANAYAEIFRKKGHDHKRHFEMGGLIKKADGSNWTESDLLEFLKDNFDTIADMRAKFEGIKIYHECLWPIQLWTFVGGLIFLSAFSILNFMVKAGAL